MTGHQSLQFIEHLRQASHLKLKDTREAADPGAPGQPQGGIQRNQQSASQIKIWEATDLSTSEFADEAARFYDDGRVTLDDMLSVTQLVG